MNFLILLVVAVVLIAICIAGMAIGLLQNKTFRSCGCAGLSYRGWVRLVTPEPHRIVIRDYAWSPFPDAPLLAGDQAPVLEAARDAV